jgi:hypothetical protein
MNNATLCHTIAAAGSNTTHGLDAPHAATTRLQSTATTITNYQKSQASSPTLCQKTKRLMKKSVCVQSTLKPKSVPRPTAPAYANDQPQYQKRGAMQVVPKPLAPLMIEARVGRLSFYLPEQVPSLACSFPPCAVPAPPACTSYEERRERSSQLRHGAKR